MLLIIGSGSLGLSSPRCRMEQAQFDFLGHSRFDQPGDVVGGRPPLDSLRAVYEPGMSWLA